MSIPDLVIILASEPSDANWLLGVLGGLQDSNAGEIKIVNPDDFAADRYDTGSAMLIMESSVGFDTVMEVLHQIRHARQVVPVVLCLNGDEQDDFSEVILYGVQEFILRERDSADVVRRVLDRSTQRIQILQASADAEMRARAIIDNISDGILIVDNANTILFANPVSEAMLGKQLIELMGAPLDLVIPVESESVVEVESAGGEVRNLSIKWVPIRWESRDVRLYTMQDVTIHHTLQKKLLQASEEAERFEALKSSFMANMSHELRLPLASIIGFGQLIEADVEDPEMKEFSATIVESGTKLLTTINSVLDLTRIDAHSFEMRRVPISLQHAAEEVVSELAPRMEDKMLPVHIEAHGDDEIKADPIVLQRIFTNIIGNAIKFTADGEITISITATHDSVVCDVTDTGIGIAASYIPHVFDEFTQESVGSSRAFNGSGLGLAITRKLIEAMGGSIDVHSEQGTGSTFSLRFPKSASSS